MTVNTENIKGEIRARWFNPVNGIYSAANFTNEGKVFKMTTPDDRDDDGNDWVLLIEGIDKN